MYQTLVSTEALAGHVDDPDWRIFDCRFDLTQPEAGREAYARGHIPGAVYAHLEQDLSAPQSVGTGRHPLPEPGKLGAQLSAWGVDFGTQVVAYDDCSGAMAARLWWLLRWLGHQPVALLDGGLQAWVRDGRPLTVRQPHWPASRFVAQPRPELVVETADVEAGLDGERYVIMDARSPERYTGAQESIDPVGGHIPGARSAPLHGNLDADGYFLPAEKLRERYQALLGRREADEAVQMCGSGVTACHNLLAMEIAGLFGARLYAGSWSEWIRDERRPVATGADVSPQ